MSDGYIRSKCMAIARSHFLYTPYKNDTIVDWYKVDGVANKVSEICHYCTIDTLNAILEGNCLRFTDIRFLNDSTEFIEVISLIKQVLSREDYTSDFKNLLLNSDEIHELENYKQSYVGFSRRDHDYRKIDYHTYTCSFSTNSDSLSMWNYYAKDADNLDIVLPVKNGQPDYRTMEIVISAIHKLIMEEVVLYVDRKIISTRKVVPSIN